MNPMVFVQIKEYTRKTLTHQYYPFHSLRRDGRNEDRDYGDPPGNGRQYPLDLVVLPMTPQVVMIVINKTIIMEVVQIVPLLLSLEDDVDIIDVLNSMWNVDRV